jgi:hypothetical protein
MQQLSALRLLLRRMLVHALGGYQRQPSGLNLVVPLVPALQEYSTIPSDQSDPAPLNPAENTTAWNSCKDQTHVEGENSDCNVFSDKNEQLFAVYITVQRFWRYQLLNRSGWLCLIAQLTLASLR